MTSSPRWSPWSPAINGANRLAVTGTSRAFPRAGKSAVTFD
jgi:hypothetical protein